MKWLGENWGAQGAQEATHALTEAPTGPMAHEAATADRHAAVRRGQHRLRRRPALPQTDRSNVTQPADTAERGTGSAAETGRQ